MLRKPKSFIEKIADTQYQVITQKGRETKYSFKNLFGIPSEHTSAGLGREFEGYVGSLQKKGEKIGLWAFFKFFKRELIYHFIGCFFCQGLEVVLTLLINLYLFWINCQDRGSNKLYGIKIFGVLLVVAVL